MLQDSRSARYEKTWCDEDFFVDARQKLQTLKTLKIQNLCIRISLDAFRELSLCLFTDSARQNFFFKTSVMPVWVYLSLTPIYLF